VTKCHTLVLILSCEAYRDRREACLETWMRHCPPDVYPIFVIGRPGQPACLSGGISPSMETPSFNAPGGSDCSYKGAILYVDVPDTYVDLSQKTWAAIRESLVLFDYEWLFKCDDDTFANLYRIRQYPKSREYMGRKVQDNAGAGGRYGGTAGWTIAEVTKRERTVTIDKRRQDALIKPTFWAGPWADGGAGYFLSRRCAGIVAAEPLLHVQLSLYEDRFVGEVMMSHGLYLHGNHSSLRPWVDGDAERHVIGATTLHPMPSAAMRRVYWRALRAGEMNT
jgi:hypothetical protein